MREREKRERESAREKESQRVINLQIRSQFFVYNFCDSYFPLNFQKVK